MFRRCKVCIDGNVDRRAICVHATCLCIAFSFLDEYHWTIFPSLFLWAANYSVFLLLMLHEVVWESVNGNLLVLPPTIKYVVVVILVYLYSVVSLHFSEHVHFFLLSSIAPPLFFSIQTVHHRIELQLLSPVIFGCRSPPPFCCCSFFFLRSIFFYLWMSLSFQAHSLFDGT